MQFELIRTTTKCKFKIKNDLKEKQKMPHASDIRIFEKIILTQPN